MSVDRADWPEAAAYFDGYTDGRYDPEGHIEWIWKPDELYASDDGEALFIGRPGVDGIAFAIRRDSTAIWAFHPMESRWQRLADDIGEFEQGWKTGDITV